MLTTTFKATIATLAIITAASSANAQPVNKSYQHAQYNKCMERLADRDGRTGRFIARGIMDAFNSTTHQYDRDHAQCIDHAAGVMTGKYYPIR